MVTFPNAKINIGLQIVEKRPDGFHNIASCFYPIGWTDVLEVLPAAQLTFESSGIAIPGQPNQNLCLKAYQALRADFDLPPVSMHLHKAVPIGAGLGGGSADGAFTILALNQLFDLALTTEQMQVYARHLGSDCAFFVKNTPAFCFGKGDQFEPIGLSLVGKWIRLVYPSVHISTAEAYAGVIPQAAAIDLRQALQQPIATWRDAVQNDFESNISANYPVISSIKRSLYDQGAAYASMTGSGSTVYGIFEHEPEPSDTFEGCMVWQGIF
jgi:4-diphosphocytidyl-2-C-methyl-D-erythritol kinase